MTSKNEVFHRLNNQTVFAIVHEHPTVEEWAAMQESLQIEYGEELVIKEGSCHFPPTGQVWLKPVLPRIRKGILQVRSKDVTFTYTKPDGKQQTSYLPQKSFILVHDECTIKVNIIGSGYITYSLREEISQ